MKRGNISDSKPYHKQILFKTQMQSIENTD